MCKCDNLEHGDIVKTDEEGNCVDCGKKITALPLQAPKKILACNDLGFNLDWLQEKLGPDYLVVSAPHNKQLFELYEI